ncbi:MAG: hypothetical protein ACREF9_11010 [Opitutaceae bacterium]
MSPELHAWLHEQTQDRAAHTCSQHGVRTAAETAHVPGADNAEKHGCAVTMFSQGLVHHAVTVLALPFESILRGVDYRAFERLALAQPRYLHRPPQAPPAG